jgi:hypothetical protein
MTGEAEQIKVCDLCGATIYPEHIHSGRAAVVDEKLLCPICLNEQKSETKASLSAINGGDANVSLIDEAELAQSGRKVITAFGGGTQRKLDETQLQRAIQKTGTGATRVKIFHTKMNDGAVEFLALSINEWVDHNPDVDIKLVQSTVGTWEGKHPEPHLILTIWY